MDRAVVKKIVSLAFSGGFSISFWFFWETIRDIFFGAVGDHVLTFFKGINMKNIDLIFHYGIPLLFALLTMFILYLIFREKTPKQKNIQKETPEIEAARLMPDIEICQIMLHVCSFLRCPFEKTHGEITKELRSGELISWGRKMQWDPFSKKYIPHSHSNFTRFEKEDWEYRELTFHGLVQGLDRPQTQSLGSGEDHIQLTELKVNFKQVEKIWPLAKLLGLEDS